jgi:thymidylate synthase
MIGHHANDEWRRLLGHVLKHGREVVARQQSTVESLGVSSHIDMRYPIVSIRERITRGYLAFMPAEAHWILSGSNRLADIQKYAESFIKYSDNGYFMQGAYGPRVTEQLHYVCQCLRDDPNSRQAVIDIWRPSPMYTRDCPCTLSLQFILRRNMLNCVATMRSSDLWLGWPFDVFSFSMISAWVGIYLRKEHKLQCQLGTLKLTAGSQHLYTRDLQRASAAHQSVDCGIYSAMSIYDFDTPDKLMAHLRDARNGRYDKLKSSFMREFESWKHA